MKRKAYKFKKAKKTTLKVNKSYIGETIETKVDRIVNNKEPIKDGAPIVFTERKDGVIPDYNIRTDRMEVAVEAMSKKATAIIAKRQGKVVDMKKYDGKTDNSKTDNGKPESQQGTGNTEPK